jgi:hypothetical protein
MFELDRVAVRLDLGRVRQCSLSMAIASDLHLDHGEGIVERTRPPGRFPEADGAIRRENDASSALLGGRLLCEPEIVAERVGRPDRAVDGLSRNSSIRAIGPFLRSVFTSPRRSASVDHRVTSINTVPAPLPRVLLTTACVPYPANPSLPRWRGGNASIGYAGSIVCGLGLVRVGTRSTACTGR